MNKLPQDVITYSLLSFLNDSDHTKYARTNHENYKLYQVKKYIRQYDLKEVPPTIIASNKLTNIITDNIYNLSLFLTSLIIENFYFNQELNTLPIILKSLKIVSAHFNQSLNTLPITLTSLNILSTLFNQPINTLPITLTSITIASKHFNQSLNTLPITLKTLYINSSVYNQNLKYITYIINLTHYI